jgi:hypothetical protein
MESCGGIVIPAVGYSKREMKQLMRGYRMRDSEYINRPKVYYDQAKIDFEVAILRKRGLTDDKISIVQRGNSMEAVALWNTK